MRSRFPAWSNTLEAGGVPPARRSGSPAEQAQAGDQHDGRQDRGCVQPGLPDMVPGALTACLASTIDMTSTSLPTH